MGRSSCLAPHMTEQSGRQCNKFSTWFRWMRILEISGGSLILIYRPYFRPTLSVRSLIDKKGLINPFFDRGQKRAEKRGSFQDFTGDCLRKGKEASLSAQRHVWLPSMCDILHEHGILVRNDSPPVTFVVKISGSKLSFWRISTNLTHFLLLQASFIVCALLSPCNGDLHKGPVHLETIYPRRKR